MKPNSHERAALRETTSFSFPRPASLAAGCGWRRLIVCVLLCTFFGITQTVGVAAAGPAAYEREQLDQVPVPKKPVRFRLPGVVKKRGGEITLRMLVKADGTVGNIIVVKFTDADLVDPVYSAYERAMFLPGIKNGVSVNAWVTVTEKAR